MDASQNSADGEQLPAPARPRVVVVFDTQAEFGEFENYAKSKSLDVKSFLKFAGRTYMDKYPRVSRKTP
jgi:hypothetical protein